MSTRAVEPPINTTNPENKTKKKDALTQSTYCESQTDDIKGPSDQMQ